MSEEIVQISERDIEKKLKDFSALIANIETLDDKKRALWSEIYSNAICDRQNAYVLFSTLMAIVKQASTEYAVHGKTLATYVERMSRANEQLIKLAELIARADQRNSLNDTDAMFERIERGQ